MSFGGSQGRTGVGWGCSCIYPGEEGWQQGGVTSSPGPPAPFSPFLFLPSSFVTFCCCTVAGAVTVWGEGLPGLGFPDSLLRTEPFSLGDLLEVTMATREG